MLRWLSTFDRPDRLTIDLFVISHLRHLPNVLSMKCQINITLIRSVKVNLLTNVNNER